jgi:hypothetical protein
VAAGLTRRYPLLRFEGYVGRDRCRRHDGLLGRHWEKHRHEQLLRVRNVVYCERLGRRRTVRGAPPRSPCARSRTNMNRVFAQSSAPGAGNVTGAGTRRSNWSRACPLGNCLKLGQCGFADSAKNVLNQAGDEGLKVEHGASLISYHGCAGSEVRAQHPTASTASQLTSSIVAGLASGATVGGGPWFESPAAPRPTTPSREGVRGVVRDG